MSNSILKSVEKELSEKAPEDLEEFLSYAASYFKYGYCGHAYISGFIDRVNEEIETGIRGGVRIDEQLLEKLPPDGFARQLAGLASCELEDADKLSRTTGYL